MLISHKLLFCHVCTLEQFGYRKVGLGLWLIADDSGNISQYNSPILTESLRWMEPIDSTPWVCVCGRTFLQLHAFGNHQRSCTWSKKWLSNALTKAREIWAARKWLCTDRNHPEGLIPVSAETHARALIEIPRSSEMISTDSFAVSNVWSTRCQNRDTHFNV